MASENPFAIFRKECETVLAEAFKKTFPEIQITDLAFEKPPILEYGQLASSISFEIAKQVTKKPFETAKLLAKAIGKSKFNLIERVEPAGAGYINFHASFAKLATLTLESAIQLDTGYGFVKTSSPQKIIVEHTSANPAHPIHIGTARNPMLGDTIARLLKTEGHTVYRHFYFDDVGRQTSVIAYGYDKLGRPKPDSKPDHFLGRI